MHPGVKPIEEKTEKSKRVQVRLLRGYFPADPDWPVHPLSGDKMKVQRGETVELPIEEVRVMLKNGIAERMDQL